MGHAYIIDMSKIFTKSSASVVESSGTESGTGSASSVDSIIGKERPSKCKHSLRILAKEVLNEEIQQLKHDPVEDSLATQKLVKKKLHGFLIIASLYYI